MTRSVVVPVYRNERTLPDLLRQVSELYRAQFPSVRSGFRRGRQPRQLVCAAQAPSPRDAVSLTIDFPQPEFRIICCDSSRDGAREGRVCCRARCRPAAARVISRSVFLRSRRRGGHRYRTARIARRPVVSQMAATMFWRVYRRFVQPEMPEGGAGPLRARARSATCLWHYLKPTALSWDYCSGWDSVASWSRIRGFGVSRAERLDAQAEVPVRVRHGVCVLRLPITMMLVAGAVGISGALVASAAYWLHGRSAPST